ncbi:MAG: potassium transporter TrkG [Pseudomonadota bacterium]
MASLLPLLPILGIVISLFSLAMLVPLAFAFFGGDAALRAYEGAILVTAGVGLSLWWFFRRHKRELQPRDGFLLVTLIWAVLPAFAMLPLLQALPALSATDAYFEAMSGLTASGGTVLAGLDALPLSINVWRCLLQFIGGLGVVILAVAILPLLGVGGSQLFKAEIPGPMKEAKLTPRIAETARGLWAVYVSMSLLCLLAYRVAGMGWADAFMHMCSTMGLGGFSPYDASFGHWNSPAIEGVAIVFMLAAGINFARYFVVWRTRSLLPLLRCVETRAYLLVVGATTALITLYLIDHGTYDALAALRHTAFHVVSLATTTGYASTDYAQWPTFAPMLMILLGCFAGCAGSTSGGIKMVRLLLLIKQALHELVRIVHPRAVLPITLGGASVPAPVMASVIAFMLVYGMTLAGLTLVMLFSGLEPITAATAVLASVNNIGPGLGDVGPSVNFKGLSDFQTWVCTVGMLLGRLELLSVLVLFTPHFWRK